MKSFHKAEQLVLICYWFIWVFSVSETVKVYFKYLIYQFLKDFANESHLFTFQHLGQCRVSAGSKCAGPPPGGSTSPSYFRGFVCFSFIFWQFSLCGHYHIQFSVMPAFRNQQSTWPAAHMSLTMRGSYKKPRLE